MTTFGRTNTPLSTASRVSSRGGLARGVLRTAGARVIAAFAALAILFAAQVSGRTASAATVDVLRAAGATSLVALHSAPLNRLGGEYRSSARWPSGVDAPLPAPVGIELSELVAGPVAIVVAVAQHETAVAGRGYDATAPPALS